MDGDLLKIHWDLQSSYYLQGLTINYHSIGHPLTLVLFFFTRQFNTQSIQNYIFLITF